MIYHAPTPDEPLDQGDLIDGCPVVSISVFEPDPLNTAQVNLDQHRILVLTQTCDIAKQFADTFSRIGLPQPDETM